MMGTSHAATGAAAGFAAALAYGAATTHTTDLPLLISGTITGAGAALLPDLDHPNATATHSQGYLTRSVGWLLRQTSLLAHRATATRYDTGQGTHRHLTHTVAFALAVGALVAWGASAHPWAAVGVVWFTSSLALLGATATFAPQVRLRALSTWVGVSALAAVAAAALVLAGAASGPYLGVCVALGMVVHMLGDALTKQACPFLWPLRIRGKRWYDIGMPAALRFSTGAWPEKIIAGASWAVPVVGTVWVLV